MCKFTNNLKSKPSYRVAISVIFLNFLSIEFLQLKLKIMYFLSMMKKYLITGTGWACALHGRAISALVFRIKRFMVASPAKAGALLPTGSKGTQMKEKKRILHN